MTHEQVITVLADAVVTLHRRLKAMDDVPDIEAFADAHADLHRVGKGRGGMQSSLVTWQLRELDGQTWTLTLTVGGLQYDVARVQALDRDAAAKAVASQVEQLLEQAR